ncbi:hypothetical protein B0H10DRAFT_1961403 [Mycena sp. CBHHK59/15]|nr:hypothetical protein B0H10DRAFT_1961403 [Mycena sp. CBHHK59/15]
MTCATRNTCAPKHAVVATTITTTLLIVLTREKDKSSRLIFIAFVVAFYHYSRRRGARPIHINQGWYTLGKQMDTSNTPLDEGAVDTTDSDSIPAARRAHCAAELCGAKTLLACGVRNVDIHKTKARICELEAQLQPT